MALMTPPQPHAELDAGVIEEARAHQHRRWKAAAAAGALSAAIVAGILIFAGGGGNNATASLPLSPFTPPTKLTARNGFEYLNGERLKVGVEPDFTAGQALLDVTQIEGDRTVPYPTAANPAFGPGAISQAAQPGLNELLVRSPIASIHVTHLGTFTPHRAIGLPPGAKVVAFVAPANADLRVLTETAYDAAGKEIPIIQPFATFSLPVRDWTAPAAPPADGRCALSSSLTSAYNQGGQVVTTIAADRNAVGPAFLSCLETWYRYDHNDVAVGVLLNAQTPGSTPASLWTATPLPGHPGIFQIKRLQYVYKVRQGRSVITARERALITFEVGAARARRMLARQEAYARRFNRTAGQIRRVSITLAIPLLAKRDGRAWIVADSGNWLDNGLRLLKSLHITRLDVGHT